MKAAADGMRPVSFELGGKNAGIVFADCDFDNAVDGIFRSASRTPARSAWAPSACMWSARSSTVRAALKAAREAVKLRPARRRGANYGPLISQEHRRKVLSYYEGGRRAPPW
jgi:aminomuconate-semialdehyde/2-hydroxymuconate-6-semialdehyde dehydrogenase